MSTRKVRCAATPSLRLITAGEKSGRPLLAGVVFATGADRGNAMFIAPDWKDADAYRHLQTAPLQDIAWEFLRRNPDYHQAWRDFAEEMRAAVAFDVDLISYVEAVYLTSEPDSRAGTPALEVRLHAIDGFQSADGREVGPSHALSWRYGDPWGLSRMVHPARRPDLLEGAFFVDGVAVRETYSWDLERLEQQGREAGDPLLHHGRWLPLLIDLAAPIGVIKAEADLLITAEQAKRDARGGIVVVKERQARRELDVEGLRLLDATAAGADIRSIGNLLAPLQQNDAPDRPRDKRLRVALQRAQKLRDGGYRSLLWLEPMALAVKKD